MVATVGVNALLGGTSSHARILTDTNPLLELPEVEPSPVASEWMQLPRAEQCQKVRDGLAEFANTSTGTLLKMTNGIRSVVPEAEVFGADPPELVRDFKTAYYPASTDHPKYYLTGSQHERFSNLGVVKYNRTTELTSKTIFGSTVDCVLGGFTTHNFESEKGHALIYVGHIFGRTGRGKDSTWALSGMLGYMADDPSIPSQATSVMVSTSPSDNVYPYYPNNATIYSNRLQDGINKLMDHRLTGLASFHVGTSSDLSSFKAADVLAKYNLLPEIVSWDYAKKTSDTAFNVYKMLTRNTVWAVHNDESRHYLLSYVGPQGYATAEIADVFPDMLTKDAASATSATIAFINRASDTITLSELKKLPKLYAVRVAQVANPIALG